MPICLSDGRELPLHHSRVFILSRLSSHVSRLCIKSCNTGRGKSTPNFRNRWVLSALSACASRLLCGLRSVGWHTIQSPQKCLLLELSDSARSTHIFGLPATSMAMVWVGKWSANSDPPEARLFKQWHNDAIVGKDDVSIDIVIAPQLHAPIILSRTDAILQKFQYLH